MDTSTSVMTSMWPVACCFIRLSVSGTGSERRGTVGAACYFGCLIAGAPRSAQFQLLAERIYFGLHTPSSPKKLSDLVPVRVAQITIGKRQFVNFPKRNLEVNLVV
ncbi:hypothetical protein [Cupriavidus basilensis]|uniref:hypothetical protein n=1 Tax=Cupriavidus basilensis TaxID=68895 RepID=UPI0020A65A8A|nr:hypothetical protein [Cupriavidus basilensis]MCP3025094.1 hypothetical protein [Cupriavidus basilensis]